LNAELLSRLRELLGRIYSSPSTFFLFMFVGSFLLFSPYLVLPTFIDEIDNMVGGFVVSQGGAVYREFLSQHTPFMYYLFSIFALLGATDVFSYRVMFYVTLSVLIALIATRFSRYFPKWVFALWAIIYISSFAVNPNLSYTSLATHLVAIVVVYLLLQILTTNPNEKMSYFSWMVAGTASMISIFSSFISIYPIFLLSLGLFLSQFQFRPDQGIQGHRWGNWLKDLAEVLKRSVTGYVIPLLILLSVPLLTGTFDDFIFQSFILNTEIYSKYMGLGSDAWGAFLSGSQRFQNIFGALFLIQVDPLVAIRNFLNPLGVYLLAGILAVRGRVVPAVLVLLTAFGLSIRGTTGFHSQQLWAYGAMALVLSIWFFYAQARHRIRFVWFSKLVVLGSASLIALVSTTGIFSLIPSSYASFLQPQTSEKTVPSGKQLFIEAILDKNDGFFQTGLDPYTVLISQRMPVAGAYGYVPWFEEALGEEIRTEVFRARPRLIFHNPDNSVWGYVLKDFDPKLNDFIESNYTRLSPFALDGNDFAWVRNDLLDTSKRALAKLDPANWCGGYPVLINSTPEISPMDPLWVGSNIVQSFDSNRQLLAGVSLRFGTYMRSNETKLAISIKSADSLTVLRSTSIYGKELIDNGSWDWRFEPLLGYESEKLLLVVQVLTGDENNFVTLYHTQNDSYVPGVLTINGLVSSGDLQLALRSYDDVTKDVPECVALR